MKQMNKYLAILLAMLLVSALLLNTVYAAGSSNTLPKDYTKINALYDKAVKSKNHAEIIIHGQKIISLFDKLPNTKEKLDIVVPRLLNVAKSAEALGKTNKQYYYLAAEAYVKYAEMLEKQRKLNPKYDKAKLNSDVRYMLFSNAGRIYFDILKDYDKALQVYELVNKYEPGNPGVTTKYWNIAKTYEAQGNYEAAAKAFAIYIPRAEKLGWKDGVSYAQNKVSLLNFDLELYTKTSDLSQSKYYGAKFEPKSGVYFGSTYDSDQRIKNFKWSLIKNYFPKKNSTYLTYLHWEEEAKSFERYYLDAKENGIALEVAWNIKDEDIGSVLKNIKDYEGYITRTAEYFGKLDIPIFLRFAGEMNIKENSRDAKAFKEAYIFVAKIFRSKAPNAALVWSPNDISAAGRTYEEYYPGDEYVDWVGMSTYTSKYFQGKKDWGKLQDSIETTYFAGVYANPLAKMKPIIDLYGGKKPIMLSETGIGHYAKLSNEDLTSWASVQMKRLYIYGPMIYPQLKGIYYFNVNSAALGKAESLALCTNEKINQLYNDLVDQENYLTAVNSEAPFSYLKLSNNTINSLHIPLMTYTIVPKLLEPTIVYKLDGKAFETSKELPYETTLDAAKLTEGDHQLTIEVYDGSKKLKSKTYQVTVLQSGVKIQVK